MTKFGSPASKTEILPLVDMITDKEGEAASKEIERWAEAVTSALDPTVGISVYYDPDSSTYVIRLARNSRVLLFRFSEAQVRTPGRKKECEELLRKKIRDL